MPKEREAVRDLKNNVELDKKKGSNQKNSGAERFVDCTFQMRITG
jgi:hypothetical protein